MTAPSVAIRADASSRMGTGHVMRCLTLAAGLRERGARVRFVCRRHSGHLIELITQRGFPVAALPAPPESDPAGPEDYAAWAGVGPAEDARQTLDALTGVRHDWLVVDHYGLDATWETPLHAAAVRLMAIDDLANRQHDCDLLLDQNFSDEGARRYDGLVGEGCERLVGPRFALLRPEFAAHRHSLRARDGRLRKLLVFFGGSDPHDMTGQALAAIDDAGLDDAEVDVVAGANCLHRERLAAQVARRPRTMLHAALPHLADLMAGADLVLGAGGATNLERLCVAVPTLVVSIAENQRHTCEALSRAGAILYLGHADRVGRAEIATALRQCAAAPSQLLALSVAAQPMVDGLGVARIVDALLSNPNIPLKDSP